MEEHLLKTNQRPSLPRPLILGAAALFTLLLSACGTVSQPTARAGIDMDSLLISQTGRPSAVTKSIARRTTREDPNSGLQVDLGPAAILTVDDEAVAQANNREAKLAAGAPTDPLRPDATLNLDDRDATTDLWARVRHGFQLPELDHELVGQHERYYASRPEYVQRMTARANRYLFHVVDEIERRHMPAELALLPFIESAFNPQATSSARASGIWQFMPATGKDFDLTQNIFRDERRDVLASTRAALDYLQRLHRMFGDWHLALAAYNWGEGNVQRAIKRNVSQGLPADYLSISMPAETRNYVPKLQAVRNIVARPEAYNLTLTPIDNHPYFVSVPIQRDMDVALAARLAALPVDEFKALNPSQNKPVILAAGTPQVLLPYDNAHVFVRNLSKHTGALATWTAWQVPKTMRPVDVAKQLGMPESTLREVNHIPPKMLVKAGSTLLVHRSEQRERDVSEAMADNAMMALAPDVPPLRRMALKAGKRDTVSTVAKRYGVSADQVASWNKIGASARFKRGEQIVVYVPHKNSAKSSRTLASSQPTKRSTAREETVSHQRMARSSKTVTTVAKRSSTKSRAGVSTSRNARVRVASAR